MKAYLLLPQFTKKSIITPTTQSQSHPVPPILAALAVPRSSLINLQHLPINRTLHTQHIRINHLPHWHQVIPWKKSPISLPAILYQTRADRINPSILLKLLRRPQYKTIDSPIDHRHTSSIPGRKLRRYPCRQSKRSTLIQILLPNQHQVYLTQQLSLYTWHHVFPGHRIKRAIITSPGRTNASVNPARLPE